MTADEPCNAQHGVTIRYPGHTVGTRALLRCGLPVSHIAEDRKAKDRLNERLLAGKKSLGVAGQFPAGAPIHTDGTGFRWTDPEWEE